MEKLCNELIEKNMEVYIEEKAKASAEQIDGLRAMFGAKYGETVRVVSIGQDVSEMITAIDAKSARPSGKYDWGRDYSVEFCGGTHVRSTKQIHKFTLLEETAISQGVRRIVACTGSDAAVNAVLNAVRIHQDVKAIMGFTGDALDKKIGSLRQQLGEDKTLSLLDSARAYQKSSQPRTKSIWCRYSLMFISAARQSISYDFKVEWMPSLTDLNLVT